MPLKRRARQLFRAAHEEQTDTDKQTGPVAWMGLKQLGLPKLLGDGEPWVKQICI